MTLFVFGLCGSLLPRSTGSLELGRALGCWPAAANLESGLERGELETPEFAVKLHQLWAGAGTLTLTPEIAARAVDAAPWIGNLRRVLADIDASGDASLVITTTPDVFAHGLRSLGIQRVFAQPFGPLPLRPGVFRPHQALTPRHKPTLVRQVCVELAAGDAPLDVVAFGAGMSNLELFAELPGIARRGGTALRVAVNASAQLRDRADVVYDGSDLWEAYRMCRARLRRRELSAVMA